MTKQIPVYDIGINESLEVQNQKQKALAEQLGVDVGGGEKLFYAHGIFLLSSIRGLVRPDAPDLQEKLEEWRKTQA